MGRLLNLIGMVDSVLLGEKLNSLGILHGAIRDIASGSAMYNFEGAVFNEGSPEAKLGVSLFANYSFEICQGFHVLPGTFDPKDFLWYTLGALGAYATGKTIQKLKNRTRIPRFNEDTWAGASQ
jgi:hypothetical protein